MELTANEAWIKIRASAQAVLPEQTYRTWLASTESVSLSDNTLVVSAPTKFAVEWVEDKYGKLLRDIAQRELAVLILQWFFQRFPQPLVRGLVGRRFRLEDEIQVALMGDERRHPNGSGNLGEAAAHPVPGDRSLAVTWNHDGDPGTAGVRANREHIHERAGRTATSSHRATDVTNSPQPGCTR